MGETKSLEKIGILGYGEVGQAIGKFYEEPKIKDLKSRLIQKSHTLTRSLSYNPSKSDLIVKTDIYLVPANNAG